MAGTGPAMTAGRDSLLDFVAARLSEDSGVANAKRVKVNFPIWKKLTPTASLLRQSKRSQIPR